VDAKYASEELFHFVGYSSPTDDEENYRKLGYVLRDSCVSHSPHDGSWGTTSYCTQWDSQLITEQLIVPTVTCYADIPFDSLSIHTSKYGKFGLSLPSWLLIKYGARPVIYIPIRFDDWQSPGLTLLSDIEAVVKGFNEQVIEKQPSKINNSRHLGVKPDSSTDAISAVKSILLKDFLAFIKPYNSELPITHKQNYYMEREWRKYGNMKFETKQVSRLVVARGYKQRILNDFPVYGDTPIYEI
jgi:hypothetical protein